MSRACKEDRGRTRASQLNRPGDASGKAVHEFDERENTGAGRYEKEAKRDTSERLYRTPR